MLSAVDMRPVASTMSCDLINSNIECTFDLVFIDADKPNYVNYFNLIIEKMNPGGVILTDNVLWSGKVIGKEKDEETQSIHNYNKY